MYEVFGWSVYLARTGFRYTLHQIKIAGWTARYLWEVRAAIPWYIKAILAVAMAVKCLPFDGGVDEALTALAVWLLNKKRPGLVRYCLAASKMWYDARPDPTAKSWLSRRYHIDLRHYRNFRRMPELHRLICVCRGHGLQYHILGMNWMLSD